MRPVELTVCDACHNKGMDTEAVTKASMSLGDGSRAVDLCEEHKGLFVAVMDKLMPVSATHGVGVAGAAAPAAVREAKAEPKREAKGEAGLTAAPVVSESVQVQASTQTGLTEAPSSVSVVDTAQGAAPRVSRHEDLQDYCQRITDGRKAMKGRKLDPASQSARAQWARHRSRFQDICTKEQSHFVDWAGHHEKDVRLTASHVEFRGWLWKEFPRIAKSYVEAGRSQDVQTSDVPAVDSTNSVGVAIRDNIGRPIVKAETIRAWARQNGYEVANRGRIPASIREAFKAAQAA
ncbi:histone-like nucleoid-structuring protein Lsr2 [Streptomyces sp. NPDC088178]|uniref:Lsr2 family DNA-binding protein n=1 Tax=Streptomyces sp. NPDC088178 TaxID=3365836 RepID=UPI0037F8E830